MPMANKRTMTSEGTNNLAGLTDSLKSLTENTHQETVLSKSANTRLDSLSTSFGKDAKLQSKLVKLGKFEQVMDIASYMLSTKSQELNNKDVIAAGIIIKQGKRFQENQGKTITEQEKSTNLESKTELHASINNDLLNRIHMVLVTRLDRILEGIQHMVPDLDKSAIGPKDFQSAMEKMYSMSREGNKELKANIDDIRFRRADRKNKRELEEIAYLRKQGKFAEAAAREKARKAKELELEGRNPDGSARRNPTRYHHWKGSDTDDTESVEKNPSWVGNMFRKMIGTKGAIGAKGMGILGLLKSGVPALFKLFKSLGKLFLKGGALGLLIYSVMPFLDTLKSKEFGTKWDKMKTRFISLKETFMPIFTKIDDFMTSIGESLGPWAAGAIITVGNGLITLLDGIGKLFSEDEDTKTKGWTQLKKFLLGENAEGGMIRSLGEFIIDMLDKTYEALLSSDFLKDIVNDLFTPDFSKISDLGDGIKKWIDGDPLFPEHGSKQWSLNELAKSEKEKAEKDDEYNKSELENPQIVSKSPEGNNLWDSIMDTLGVGAQITNVDNSVTHNNYSSSDQHIANLAAEPPRDGKNRQAMAELNSMQAI